MDRTNLHNPFLKSSISCSCDFSGDGYTFKERATNLIMLIGLHKSNQYALCRPPTNF